MLAVVTFKGQIWAKVLPAPVTSETIAKAVKQSLGPWLKSRYPDKQRIRLLLDGEGILRAPPAMNAFNKFGIKIMEGWPKYPIGWRDRQACMDETRQHTA